MYTFQGGKNPSCFGNFYEQSTPTTLHNSDPNPWTYGVTSSISFSLEDDITLTLTSSTNKINPIYGILKVEDEATLTLSGNSDNSDNYIYRVRLMDGDDNVIGEYWDLKTSFTKTFKDKDLTFKKIEIFYGNTPYIEDIASGSGTSTDPYIINNTGQLDALAQSVNSDHDFLQGKFFELGDDISYSYDPENNFTPIGSLNNPFKGHFDGKGHTISGITVTRTGSTSDSRYIGLFGQTDSGGTVQNVVLASSNFTGYLNIGGIVGYNKGTVRNCRVESSVTIKAGNTDANNHGGIVGFNRDGTIIGCVSAASIQDNSMSGHYYCGGIAGYVSQDAQVKDCLYTGSTVEANDYKGAIIGFNSSRTSTFTNNYYTNISLGGMGADGSSSDQDGARRAHTVTLGENVSIVGDETAYSVSGLAAIGSGNYALRYNDGTTTQIYSGEGQALTFTYTGAVSAEGYNIAIYVNDVLATDNGNGTYTATMPAADATVTVVVAPIPWSGSGDSANDPYLIEYPSQLDLLATNVNSGTTYEGKFFKLGADITYSTVGLGTGESNYTPIGTYNRTDKYFRGTFDGAGHTISGIVVNAAGSYIGLFGDLGAGATVQNIVLASSTFTGNKYVGGIVGSNEGGTVRNCRVESTVSLYAEANYAYYHGGIAGNLRSGQIAGCVSAAAVSHNSKDDRNNYGGIVGYVYGGAIVKDCLYTGSTVTASDVYGAIAGMNQGGTITNNYYTNGNLGGVGDIGTSADQDGARRAHTVTLGNGVSITGDQTAYDVSGLAAIGTVTLSYDDGTSTLLYSGEGQTLTFSSDGTASAGFSVNGAPILGASYTMPAGDISVEADFTPWTGTGSKDDPIIIITPSQLDLLAIQVNSGVDYAGTYFKLGADINYSTEGLGAGESNYTPIGRRFDGTKRYFCGTFDGQGHTVSGITVTRTGTDYADLYIGLFGYTGFGSTVQNVVLANSTLTGNWSVGGIVGSNENGTIRNCRVESSVTINAGDDGAEYHGGIAGRSDGSNAKILGCVSAAAISNNDKDNCSHRGGIIGTKAGGIVRDCLYTGTTVTGKDNLGGILGEIVGVSGTLVGNYYTADGLGGVGRNGYSTGTDCDGAMHAVTSATKPEAIGAQTAVYPHGGLTAYENGVYYRGVYYIREDMGGGLAPATALNLVRGTKDGITAWWGTFYDGSANYRLSGATAYTMGTDRKLYRLGDDGLTIPAGTAVVIIATSADAALTAIDSASASDHATGGNILRGFNSPTAVSGTPYVLGIVNGVLGFYEYKGGDVPAHKAYYCNE